ncbi:hypothetical protein CHS0354_016870 [Potamilus streckersoni]|uniref:Uncharacterized protein n=1 Tax=Potamilus streckersoni TaxID=2493646 RepID=A0AAE0VR68_9BIVA|nr:hypothetical protein CHS0354_016870 [Potamilus streckersoni]
MRVQMFIDSLPCITIQCYGITCVPKWAQTKDDMSVGSKPVTIDAKLNTYFRTELDNGGSKSFLKAYHSEGCHTIDFGAMENCPRRADIITALKSKDSI